MGYRINEFWTHHTSNEFAFAIILRESIAATFGPSGCREGYLRTRALDQYRVNTAFWLFCNRSATSSVSKGRSSESNSRLTNSVISSAVLGFLIVFSAREMCASRRRLELGICLIPTFSSQERTLSLRLSRFQHWLYGIQPDHRVLVKILAE